MDDTVLSPARLAVRTGQVDLLEVEAPRLCTPLDRGRDVGQGGRRMCGEEHGTSKHAVPVFGGQRPPQVSRGVRPASYALPFLGADQLGDPLVAVALGERVAA